MHTRRPQENHRGGRNPAQNEATTSWSEKLRQLALAPFRLHHYRDVHVKMLRDALCQMDCRPESGER